MTQNHNPYNKPVQQTFISLKKLFLPYEKHMNVVVNQDDTYYIDASSPTDPTQYDFFGAVQMRGRLVSFYFVGFHKFPGLFNNISPSLRSHKSLDNNFLAFRTIREQQLIELERMIRLYLVLSEAQYEKETLDRKN